MITRRLLTAVLAAGAVVLAASLLQKSPGLAQDAPPIKESEAEVPSTTAGMLNGQMRLSLPTTPECDRYRPAVAYNSARGEYLVVWHNSWPDGHRDIYARRITEQGILKSWFAVSAGSHDRAQPAVAYNVKRNEYLVVWMYNANGDGNTYEIWGRRVSYDGASMGPEFQIITWPNRTFYSPQVAHNWLADRYLVVWTAHDTATLVPTDVSLALLDGDGTKLYHTIISDTREPHQVDVAYSGWSDDEFLVVWRQMYGPADGDIVAARIGGYSGHVINFPGVFVVSNAGDDQMSPSVAANGGNRYMVVWQHAYPGPCCDWDVRGQELDTSGGLVGAVFTLGGSSDDETAPRITAVYERRFMAVWQRATSTGEAVWAKAWGEPGWQFSGQVTAGIAWNYEQPALAANNLGAFIAYEGDSGSNPLFFRHIYGQRWIANAVLVPLVIRSR
jgi:hypothetical protein